MILSLEHLLEGFFLGFSVGTTIGMSGILCLQNMMSGRFSLGLGSVFAAALADMTCGVLALFGMQFLETFLFKYQKGLTIAAGVLLCFLGVKKLFERIALVSTHQPSGNLLAALGSVYFLGMLDPVSVLDFVALSVGLVVDFSVTYHVLQFILGIFLGSLSWWGSLFAVIFILKKGISVKFFEYMQYLIGTGIFCLGLWTLKNAIF